MKKNNLLLCLAFELLAQAILAQTSVPQGFNYQAIVRDASGAIASNVQVKFTFRILFPSGTVSYSEEQITTTNEFGLVNLVVGTGTQTGGVPFADITWGTENRKMNVLLAVPANATPKDLGTQPLMSVPYALSAKDNFWDDYFLNGYKIQNKDKYNVVIASNSSTPFSALEVSSGNPEAPAITGTVSGGTQGNNHVAISGVSDQNIFEGGGIGVMGTGGEINSDPIDDIQDFNIGVYGSSLDYGVFGRSLFPDGTGVIGIGGEYGVIGSGDEYGVLGEGPVGIYAIGDDKAALLDGVTEVSGELRVFPSGGDFSGKEIHEFSTTASGAGYYAQWSGQATAHRNLLLTNLSGEPDHAYLAVKWQDANRVVIYLDGNEKGVVSADNLNVTGTKNFRIKHPTQAGKEIWYACIEGPEAAVYQRGTAQLVNGVAEIPFTDDFKLVSNPANMTVILTPGSADSKGLAIIEKGASSIKVKELLGGTGNYSFDWEVKCVRKGFEDYKVVRDELKELPAEPIDKK